MKRKFKIDIQEFNRQYLLDTYNMFLLDMQFHEDQSNIEQKVVYGQLVQSQNLIKKFSIKRNTDDNAEPIYQSVFSFYENKDEQKSLPKLNNTIIETSIIKSDEIDKDWKDNIYYREFGSTQYKRYPQQKFYQMVELANKFIDKHTVYLKGKR